MHPTPSPGQANFTLMTECTPESRRYYSVYSVVRSVREGGMDSGQSITTQISPGAETLSSSQPGGPPFWVIALAYSSIVRQTSMRLLCNCKQLSRAFFYCVPFNISLISHIPLISLAPPSPSRRLKWESLAIFPLLPNFFAGLLLS